MKSVIRAFIAIALLAACFGAGLAYQAYRDTKSAAARAIHGLMPPERKTELDTIAIVEKFQHKFETSYESATLHQPVWDGSCGGNAVQRAVYEDCTLWEVYAEVTAGFNTPLISADRITQTHEVVVINIGTPTVLRVYPDYHHIKPLSHKGSLKSFIFEPDRASGIQMLANVEAPFRKEACNTKLPVLAALEAEKAVGGEVRLLFQLAHDTREVRVVSNPATC